MCVGLQLLVGVACIQHLSMRLKDLPGPVMRTFWDLSRFHSTLGALTISIYLSIYPPTGNAICIAHLSHFSCCGSEAGSYLRLTDFVYHSSLGWKVMKQSRRRCSRRWDTMWCPAVALSSLRKGHHLHHELYHSLLHRPPPLTHVPPLTHPQLVRARCSMR